MKKPSYLSRLLCLAVALAWTQGSQASTVFWSSLYQDHLFDSSGAQLDASYTFEIGTFGGFTPTYENVDQWEANWHVIDIASTSNGRWDSASDAQVFTSVFNFNTDGTSDSLEANPADVFTQGSVVYLWAYNSKDILPSSEWALVADGTSVGDAVPSDDWIVPDPSDTLGSYNWNLGDASTAIIGGVNGVQSDGTYTATPPVFSLQTAVVPEPGSALLLFAAAAAQMIRRARRQTSLSLP